MKYLLPLLFTIITLSVTAQIQYTECQDAFPILDPIDWCSSDAAFNNIAVGESGYGPASCWGNANNDVWFEFFAFATAVNIVVTGNGAGNTLQNPQVALYSGDCGGTINEYACESNAGIVNLFETALVIGQKYFIRINGANNEGAFKVCINNYNPPVEPGQDCITGSVLCDKSPFVVQAVSGSGDEPDEANGSCLGTWSASENQSTWFKWTAANDGTLTFTISPLNPSDDLDFVLYEITATDGVCVKTQLRCMATSCQGPTGLNLESTDLEEDLNCETGEDGFVKFIDMIEGHSYTLMVNNFSNTGVGFGMEWGGTGEFLGPDPEFVVIPDSGLACDQEFEIINTSNSPDGIIITDYNWVFGERSVPESSDLENPPPIFYEKFGQKFIVLEVTTDKGCIVTEVVPIYAEPCCEDLEAIGLNVENIQDLICPGIPDGSFEVSGFGGSPEYEFSIEGNDNYSELVTFNNLFSGTYQVNIIDIKGCMDSITLFVDEPAPIIAEAGPDKTTTLGFTANLEGNWEPPGANVVISWSSNPVDSTMSCYDCPNPVVTPPGTTTYYMTVTSPAGCESIDSVVVRVKLERPIFTPNIFTPNNDGTNDFFNIFTNRAATKVDLLAVYDRWGEKVYEGINVPINDDRAGWDGTHNGENGASGVYSWYAEVSFIDQVSVIFKGDVTLIR